MFCPACGAADQLGVSCGECNASLAPRSIVQAQPKLSGLAITGFVFALLWFPFGLAYSAMAMSEIKRSKGAIAGRGFAIAGLIVSIVNLYLAALFGVHL